MNDLKQNMMTSIAIMLLALCFVVPAFAAPTTPPRHFGAFVNSGGVPAGSKLVLDITYKVTNDEDSGNVGYWALESYNKHIQVWQTPDGTFYAVARYTGKWQTFAGALSPGSGLAESSDASGTLEGGYIATFTSPGFPPQPSETSVPLISVEPKLMCSLEPTVLDKLAQQHRSAT